MKRTYVRPTMVGERFVANEYVAACGESGKVYKFECTAPGESFPDRSFGAVPEKRTDRTYGECYGWFL